MKFSTQFVLTTLSKTTKQISIFALSIILARYFTKADYGTYLHVQLIANVAIWSLLLGIPHSIYYFLPKTHEKRRFVMTTLSLMLVIATIVSLAILVNMDNLSALLGNPNLQNLAIIMACLVFFQIPLSIFEPLMITSKKVSTFVNFDFAFNVAFFMVVLTPVSLGYSVTEILNWVVWFHCIQFITITLVCFYTGIGYSNQKANQSDLQNGETTPGNDAYSIQEQFKYSLPIGGSLSVAEVSRYADKIIVSNQFSPDDYAVYTRGAMDIPLISIIANTLDNLLMPKFIDAYRNNNMRELVEVWHSAMRMMAAFIYPACLFLIFVAPLLIPALFSDKYIASTVIFQIYTVRLLTRISTFNVIYRAIGKTQAMFWLSIASLLVNIVLTYICIQLYGVNGAAVACVLLTLLYQGCSLKIITGYLNIEINQVLPWRSLVITLIASTVSLLPTWFVSTLNISVWPLITLMATVYGICYLATLKFTAALNESEKASIRILLPNRLSWVI
ncbi:oligosaccharide flippase family protein [Aliikangiella coralliicola]|uniref:Polysaccharide biosynthesis protein n=1 Tax=Aliikangiella coralliicola TaxID=2592383 RepID=A0A545UCK0_9GAMM|nr:oligosaccharide flippase family protein [Aliikangiella coralliicola]TQV87188.1 polysaccharide biosynthesis protein [Aliikangiella coralliicola]